MAEGKDAAMLPLDHRLPSRWIWQKGGPRHAAAVVDGGGGEEKKWRGREKGEEVERKREGRRREEEVDCGREFERERGGRRDKGRNELNMTLGGKRLYLRRRLLAASSLPPDTVGVVSPCHFHGQTKRLEPDLDSVGFTYVNVELRCQGNIEINTCIPAFMVRLLGIRPGQTRQRFNAMHASREYI
uniref:Uncharacterized protein n=1 Tax=Oryza glumipatula TaxID=40148 RepID=A0A0D9Y7D8_9ORYZ